MPTEDTDINAETSSICLYALRLEVDWLREKGWTDNEICGLWSRLLNEYESTVAQVRRRQERDQKGLDRLQRSQLEAIDYAGLNPADGPPISGARLGVGASAPYKCNVPMCGDSGVCEECRKRGAK